MRVETFKIVNVKAFDTLHPEAGFLWFMPITIIVPMSISDSGNFALSVSNLASIYRFLFTLPVALSGQVRFHFFCIFYLICL